MSDNKERKFNTTLIRAYSNKKGFMSVDIDSEAFDAMQKIELGGRLVLKQLKEKKNEKSPDAYFEYMTPDQVTEMKAYFKKMRASSKKQSEDDVL